MEELLENTSKLYEIKKYDKEYNEDEVYSDSNENEMYEDDEEDEYLEDEEDFLADDCDNLLYQSPLVASCSVTKLKEGLEKLSMVDPHHFERIISTLDNKDQERLSRLLSEAAKISLNRATPLKSQANN